MDDGNALLHLAQHLLDATDEMEAALGYVVGGIATVPQNEETRTMVDASASAPLDTVYCGIGRTYRTLEIAIADVIAVADAQVAPIVQQPASVA